MIEKYIWKNLEDTRGWEVSNQLIMLLGKLKVLKTIGHGIDRKLGVITELSITIGR